MKIKYVTYFFVLSFGNILFLFSKTIPNLPYGFPIELRHSTYCSCSDTLPLNDSLQVTKDSVIVKPRPVKDVVDAPVLYHSQDSTRIDLIDRKIYLYGNAFVSYKDIELTADYMEINFDNNTIFAKGLPDSNGVVQGKPHFKQKDDEFDAKEITYNFKTKKGIILQVRTKQGEGFLISERTKKFPEGVVCLKNGKYTTCDKEHPDFYIELTKAKIIPNDKIVSGPAYLVIEDIPLPLILPFGFFPNKKGQASGVLIPEYGEETNRGFFFRNGGYYFAINDYFDAQITGDIFSLGSWGTHFATNYKKRYKFSGKLNFDYSKIIISEKGLPNYLNQNSYRFLWNHSQDSKARPNSSFRANVNLVSSSYSKYVSTNFNQRMQNTAQSNIAYTKRFAGTPFNFSVNFRHSQNNTDSSITLSIPELNLNMRRIYPLKRKKRVGKLRFYEKIGLTYTSNTKNTIQFKQDDFSPMSDFKNYKNGIKHAVPISANFSFLKHFNVTPAVVYNERWYFKSVEQHWQDTTISGNDTIPAQIVVDTIRGFVRSGDYSINIPLTTKIYGFYQFLGKNPKIKAIRHLMTPSIAFNYRPDYSRSKYGYFLPVPNDTNEQYYSVFGNDAIYGAPPTGKYGSIKFSLGNNLEMKTRQGGDTSKTFVKIPLLQSFNISSFYNLAADSMNWNNINITGRTSILKTFNISFNGVVNPYAVNESGTPVNTLMWKQNNKIGRLTNARISLSFSLNNKTFNKETKQNDKKNKSEYADFYIPWNLNVSYNWSYLKPGMEKSIVQTTRISGNLDLTSKWKIDFTLGYDFKNKKFTYPSLRILRDLHCWAMSLHIIPFGIYQSYNFQINVKASVLQDLKYNQRRNWTEYL